MAVLTGMPLNVVDYEGMEPSTLDALASAARLAAIIAEATAGFVGILSVERYGFGGTMAGEMNSPLQPPEGGISDFLAVGELVREIDPDGDGDILLGVWRDALALVDSDLVWRAIEEVAAMVERRSLTGREVAIIVDGVLDAELPPFSLGQASIWTME